MSEETLQVPEQNYGPGNVLRAKREEYEWSVEAVAEALHLSTHSVKAIEADRYDDLPGATYVIGYWRSYARLLGINIEETIEVNKRNLNIVTAEAAGLDVNRAFRHKTKNGGKGGLLLLILLGALAYYAWQQQFWGLLDSVMPAEDAAVMENVQPDGTIEPAAKKEQEQVLRPLKIEEPTPAIGSDGAVVVNENNTQVLSGSSETGLLIPTMQKEDPVIEQVVQPGNQSGLILAAAPTLASASDSGQDLAQAQAIMPEVATVESSEQSADPVPVEGVSPAVNTEVTAASSQLTSDQAASGMATMTLVLSKDSWLDIRDKTRTRLLYKTEKAGKQVDVTGIPPFYIYIGTPDGVTIRYKGKDVPFETHKTGMFARFKLDDETLESL